MRQVRLPTERVTVTALSDPSVDQSPADMPPNNMPPSQRPRIRWGAHFERLLFAVLAVALVAVLVQRLTDSDSDTDSASVAAPAPTRTLADSAAELEAKAANDPGNATLWQQLTQVYVQRAAQTLDPSFYGRAEASIAKAKQLAELLHVFLANKKDMTAGGAAPEERDRIRANAQMVAQRAELLEKAVRRMGI